ncbi:MAG: lipopolysaccharide kinase InaA family protein, partial [Thermodesulfobacteriota bacterium]|nr:lipopolysaccharide kinase InaA family protein [Thermodesulfobacteriota bacterium]
GLRQKDLHLDNFLYSQGRWYTIDGDGVNSKRAGTALNIKDSLDNLALFFAQLPPSGDYLIKPALTEYCQARHQTRQFNVDVLSTSLVPLLFKVRKKRRLNYVKKSYRSCSEFIRSNTIHQTAIYRRDADHQRISQLLANPDTLITHGEMLKDGNSATVVRILHPQGNWVIKRYNIKGIWHAMKRCLRPSRAWVSWGNTQRLNISNIATPQAIAMIEKRFGPLRLSSYYVCEHINAPGATEYFSTQPTGNIETAQQFVTLFSVLLQLGIYHGDCKGTNFLIRDGQPWVIDLDSMREFCWRRRFLHAYPIDQKRFLRNWASQPQLQRWFEKHLPG